MKNRLAIAFISTALASVFLVGFGVLAMWQVGAQARAKHKLETTLEDLAPVVVNAIDGNFNNATPLNVNSLLIRRSAFGLDDIALTVVDENGQVLDLALLPHRRKPKHDRLLTTTGIPIAEISHEKMEDLRANKIVPLTRDNKIMALQPLDIELIGTGKLAIFGAVNHERIPLQAVLWFLISSAVVLIGAGLTGLWMAQRLTLPLSRIEKATKAISAGEFNADLEVQGKDELASLANSVNVMANELQRSKVLDRQFLLSVSHDLRTPLTTISGYAEALIDKATTDTTAAGQAISANAKRLQRLVEDLLDLAKLDANRFKLRTESVDLSILLQRLVRGMQLQAKSCGIDIEISQTVPITAEVDPDRISQVIGNIIDNAIKFAKSQVQISITKLDTEQTPALALITIRDDGPGIAAEDIGRVFERLYSSRTQPERAKNPSGLGLAIANELTTAMGGSLKVANAVNGGAVFKLTVPTVTTSHPK